MLDEQDNLQGASLREQASRSVMWNVALLPLRYLLPLVSSIVVVRVLGVANYGLLASLWAIVASIELWADFGIAKSLPKFETEIRTRWGERTSADFLMMLIVLHVLFFGTAAGAVILFSEQVLRLFNITTHKTVYLTLITLLLLLDAPTGVLRGALISRFCNKQINIIDLLKTALNPALSIAAALLGLGVVGILASSAIVSAIVLVSSIVAVSSLVPWGGWSPRSVSRLGRVFISRFAVYSAFTYLLLGFRYFTSPMFMILMMNVFGMQPYVAYFKIASSLVSTVQGVASVPLSYTIAAVLGRTFLDKDHERLRRAYATMSRVLLLSMVPLSVGLAALAGPAIRLLFGEEFMPTKAALQVLILLQMVVTVFPYSGSILHTYEKYRHLLVTGVLGILVSVGSCILLIPRLGHVGAALAAGLGGIALSLSGTLMVHRMFGLRYPADFAWKIIISCLPMAVWLFFWERVDLNWYHLLGFIAYAVTAFFLLFKLQGGLCQADRKLLAQSGIPRAHMILRLV